MVASLSDSCISFVSLIGDPSLESVLIDHHGMVRLHSLQKCKTYISPSDRLSRLRGLASSGMVGSGENNLAFKCTRKRIVIETLHLDVEGGVGERRTAHPDSTLPGVDLGKKKQSTAAIEIDEKERDSPVIQIQDHEIESKSSKPRKGVAFRLDRPDLYDF